ncbi:Tim44/TimA family putative adaptor protein [Methylocystis parvus]|uniref:Tim44 domain-containing protein n=1 Tax=Methylocystis parvus TaxID=134 RepID=A0A6B8M5R9_9HYPH|nr:Tim44/TimA family putative adaptor protein [Methylocystis parvus]QGM97079.1 Tim44 domain-containing protein [Methylocystis parvus]WBJ99019.1 Tim44/TimA family putative adaptor protein [Methylocystis parvus OBBP]
MSPSGEPFDPSLVVFAALAIFVVWKLRSVLGMRVDREEAPPPPQFQPRRASLGPAPLPGAPPADDLPPVRHEDRWAGVAEKNAAAAEGLDAIAAADSRFDGHAFLDGARRAYEIIVGAFAAGDRDTLRPLLSKDVYDGFAHEIARREAAGETVESAIVAIDSALVEAARAAPRLNEVTVRFAVRLMNVRKDKSGEVIEGGNTTPVEELWTFGRDPRASDPNWKLTATRAA